MKQVFDLESLEQLGTVFKDMKLLHDMRVTNISNKDNCLIFEYENNDLNDSLFEEYDLDKYEKVIIRCNYDNINYQDVFVQNSKKKKYEEYELNEFLNLIVKKNIKLQWIDYFLSNCEIYLEFVNENDWSQYIRFDLCLQTIEYDWIEKRINIENKM